jgi:hypothetical protein
MKRNTIFLATLILLSIGALAFYVRKLSFDSAEPKQAAQVPNNSATAIGKPNINLSLPDCPQGVTAPITGPKCIQPHFRKLPPYPDPVENNKTLAGIDSDKDGVRDDVQWAIAEMFANSERMRAATMQYAGAAQKYYSAPSALLKDKAVLVTEEGSRASLCVAAMLQTRDPNLDEIDAIGEAQSVVRPLTNQINNTPERALRYQEISRNMSGAAFTGDHVRGKSWDSLCTFDLNLMKD